MKRLLWIITILLLSISASAQVSGPARKIAFGTSDPAVCRSNGNNIFFRTDTGQLKVCTATNTWGVVGGGAGSGDVVGPASSTDGAPVLFDGATGKLTKNSTPTGTGNPVLQTSPTLTTPVLGVASATSINKITITQPATGATLTIPDGVTLNAGAGGTLGSNAFNSTAFAPAASPTFTTAATFSFLTAGSIPFAGTAGLLSQDNATFFWDNTNKRLGIGTTTPSASIDNKGSMTGHTGISGDVIIGSEVAYGARIRPTITAGADGGDLFGLWLNPDFQDAGHSLVGHLNLYSGPPQASFDGTFTLGQTVYGTNFFGSVNVAPSHFAAIQAVNQDSSTNSTFGINTTVESRHTSGTKSQLSGIESDVYTSTAGNVTTMAGVIAFTQHSGAGTVAKQVGLFTSSGASTGTATLGAGVYIANGSMAPTTKHGLYVETQTGGGTNYSLFVNGGLSHLGGIIEAGSGPTTLTDTAGKILSAALNTVGVAQGGTSLATLTANNVILGNGTSAPLFVAPGTSGNVLTSNGTTWTSAAAAGGGTTINATNGVIPYRSSSTAFLDSPITASVPGSMVDGITVTGAATANPAIVNLTGTGSDSNISVQLTSKGTGKVLISATGTGSGDRMLYADSGPLQVGTISADSLRLTTGGTARFIITQVALVDGSGSGGTANINYNVDPTTGPSYAFVSSTTTGFSAPAANTIGVWSNGTKIASWLSTGNLKIAGTAVRGTTEGTNHIDIFNGTAPVGTLANGGSVYASGGELFVIDAGGTATQISPHDSDGNWIFNSTDTKTGRRLKIDVEKMLRFLNEKFGTNFIHEFAR
jgi:hypothetical protein